MLDELHSRDWMADIEQDYENIKVLVNRISDLATQGASPHTSNAKRQELHYKIIEGIILLKKVMQIK